MTLNPITDKRAISHTATHWFHGRVEHRENLAPLHGPRRLPSLLVSMLPDPALSPGFRAMSCDRRLSYVRPIADAVKTKIAKIRDVRRTL